jgi:hypothetical protein
MLLVVEVIPFISAPPPRNIKTQKTPPKHPQTPVCHRPASTQSHALTQPPPRANNRCPLSSAAQARESHAPPSHTPPHAELFHTGTHTPQRPHPPRPHAGSCSAAAYSCQAPVTTPTPHSPVSVGPGADSSSVLLAIEPLALVSPAVDEPDVRELPVPLRHGPSQFI